MAAAGVALLAGALVIYRSAQREPAVPDDPAPAARAPDTPPVETPAARTSASPPEPVVSPPASSKAAASRRAAAPVVPPSPPAATTGTVTVTADVAGAQVFLDRQFIGTAPVTQADVAPGSHQLNVSAPGYDPMVLTIDVAAGPRDIAVRFREVRLDLALDVVHKHRLGSCRGRLLATAQGLRYETADASDAFAVPLLDLETFQVDYLAKALRVQPRRGRRYEFTDPEGNADRLFVFHRDVDKAREQLRKGDTP